MLAAANHEAVEVLVHTVIMVTVAVVIMDTLPDRLDPVTAELVLMVTDTVSLGRVESWAGAPAGPAVIMNTTAASTDGRTTARSARTFIWRSSWTLVCSLTPPPWPSGSPRAQAIVAQAVEPSWPG
jgi:hypothetical protein